MKTNINVLIIDDNTSLVNKMLEYFSSHAVIKVVKTINNVNLDGYYYARS